MKSKEITVLDRAIHINKDDWSILEGSNRLVVFVTEPISFCVSIFI